MTCSKTPLALLCALFAASSGCSGAEDSGNPFDDLQVPDRSNNPNNGTPNPPSNNPPGSEGNGGVGVTAPPQNGEIVDVSSPAPGAEQPSQEACSSQSTPTQIQEVVLAFAFDVSASMAETDLDVSYKWEPTVAGTKAFFEDPASTGVSATLTFFPSANASTFGGAGGGFGGFGGGGAGGGNSCSANDYAAPDVELTSLPSTDFGVALDAVEPNRLGTPTAPALQGVIGQIDDLRAQDPNRTYAIVLVTDGVPALCGGGQDDIGYVAEVVAGVADQTPTYVIGMEDPDGPSGSPEADELANLEELAQAGGTGLPAFLIDTTDPQQTLSDFLNVIEQIKENAFGCNVGIPEPPAGRTFNKDYVDVAFAQDGSEAAPFVYDPTCTAPNGWHFDSEEEPTTIILCESACNSVKTAPAGKLDVQFRCDPRPVTIL